MTSGITRHGRDVDEAVRNALSELGVSRDEVRVEVIEEGSRGILGIIGQREARVRVTVDRNKVRYVLEFVRELLSYINEDAEVTASESDQVIACEIEGDDLGLIIGRHGATLNALQYLANVAAGRSSSDRRPVVLDAGNYRQRRKRNLTEMAERMALRAAKTGRSVRMEPLPPHERKIIHVSLQDHPQVTTESQGQDPHRYVVITPLS
ncbi:MAG: RNA-binding cell elongation regulator Jag/EloR [Bacillota bacterium]